jgi:hypothetical protein
LKSKEDEDTEKELQINNVKDVISDYRNKL